jgi:hypothetical protein
MEVGELEGRGPAALLHRREFAADPRDVPAPRRAESGNRAASAVNNHRAKIAVGGISDLETTDYFSRLAGIAEFAHSSTSTGRGKGGDPRTEGDTYRELAPQHLLRELEFGRARCSQMAAILPF